ncbi:MAG: hypothetical protein EOO11_21395 [Chitinophagaceae bacterium]|nr:MAG: hypothetical protein EOO11_21395 [Chitinophagaceae bacterium]
MENKLLKEVRLLRAIVVCVVLLYAGQLFMSFDKRPEKTRFEEIDVERINIIEKDGTLKMALFNAAKMEKGVDQRQGQGESAGMHFYNQEGYECGGLTFRGKKLDGGQHASAGLMFDGYRQDQAVVLEHVEGKDSTGLEVRDGLGILYRPDRSLVREEYDFYKRMREFKGSQRERDSLEDAMADAGKVTTRRLFVGTRRKNEPATGTDMEETGIFIRNRFGRDAIRLYVDRKNKPHLQFYDSTGKVLVYEVDLKAKKR